TAFRLRGGRLVLALRRRGLAVPVRLHLLVWRRPDRDRVTLTRLACGIGTRRRSGARSLTGPLSCWAIRTHTPAPAPATSFLTRSPRPGGAQHGGLRVPPPPA